MKQIDNRQKQQIFMRAQKASREGRRLVPKEKQAAPSPSSEPERETGKEAAEKDVPPAAAAPADAVRSGPKVGRNDPCPCGSGKKYKKCCLK